MEATKVGIREFRAGMAEFISSSTPVAVTRHGQTIGYFIPTHGQADADVASLKKRAKRWIACLQPRVLMWMPWWLISNRRVNARRRLSKPPSKQHER